jgi:prophage maintenance system killer protein
VSPWDSILTVDQLVVAARQEFERSRGGAQFTATELECVRGKFGNAWSAELYVDDPELVSGFVFACALLVGLIRGHCLVDGNKRVGWLALTLILARLGLDIEASPEEAEQLCLDVIAGTVDRVGVAQWLAPRLS